MKNKNFILGGYYLVLPTERTEWMNKDLVSKRFISVSDCISNILVGSWNINSLHHYSIKWDKVDSRITEYQNLLKVPIDKLKELSEDVTRLYENKKFGVGNIFTDIEAARGIYHKHLSHLKEVKLLGVGLSKKEYEIFKKEELISKDDYYYGVNMCFNKKERMKPANILGFDVLGYERERLHSYLCTCAENEIYNDLGIKVNEYSLFNTYEEADKVSWHIINNELGELAFYQPWIISEYCL